MVFVFDIFSDQLWSTIYTQVKVLFFRYEDTMSKFACRFSLLNSLPCADSCFVPEIQHGWMKPKSSHYAVRSDVNHDTMVSESWGQLANWHVLLLPIIMVRLTINKFMIKKAGVNLAFLLVRFYWDKAFRLL